MDTSLGRLQEKDPALFKRLGRTVVHEGELPRHSVYTRFLHWAYGVFFFLALLSGFAIYLPFLFRVVCAGVRRARPIRACFIPGLGWDSSSSSGCRRSTGWGP